MATTSSIEIRSELVKLFPDALLRYLARECGVVQRQRKLAGLLLPVILWIGVGIRSGVDSLSVGVSDMATSLETVPV